MPSRLPPLRTLRALLGLMTALLLPPLAALSALPASEPADLVLVSGPEPETLDPAVASRVVDLRVVSALVEPLVSLDPATLLPRPAAAATWTADPGGVTFTLREGLRFSTGEPITAGAFVDGWRRAADPATGAPFAAEAREVAAGAEALSSLVLRVAPRPPRPDLLPLLSAPAFGPALLPAIARHGERWTRPGAMPSSGPYVLAAWEPGRRIRLARNTLWRDASRVRVGSVELITTSGGAGAGDATAFRIYETGGADATFAVPARTARSLKAAGRADLHEREGAGTHFLRCNTARAPLDDPLVRRALSLAIDRAALCAQVLRGGERPARTLVPPGFGGYAGPLAPLSSASETGASSPAPRNPAPLARVPEAVATHARARLDGQTLELLYPASDEGAAVVGEVLEETWRRAFGLRLRLSPAEPKAAFAAVKELRYDVAWGSWIADYPDAMSFLAIFRAASGSNRTGWKSRAYDALLDRSAGEAGPARMATLAEAEALLLAEAPLAPLFRSTSTALVRPGVRGLTSLPFAHLLPWADLTPPTRRPRTPGRARARARPRALPPPVGRPPRPRGAA